MWYVGMPGVSLGYLAYIIFVQLYLPAKMLSEMNTSDCIYWKWFGKNGHLKAYFLLWTVIIIYALVENLQGDLLSILLNPLKLIVGILILPFIYLICAIGASFPICLFLSIINYVLKNKSYKKLYNADKKFMTWLDPIIDAIYTKKEK